ncbi:MAG: hypothetical protein R2911_15480 [Caldilineaceae bacterium]
MSRTFTHEYNAVYDPSAPFLPVWWMATTPQWPVIVPAFVDTGRWHDAAGYSACGQR